MYCCLPHMPPLTCAAPPCATSESWCGVECCGVLALMVGQFRDHKGVAPRSPSCQVMSKCHLMPGWVGHPDVSYHNDSYANV